MPQNPLLPPSLSSPISSHLSPLFPNKKREGKSKRGKRKIRGKIEGEKGKIEGKQKEKDSFLPPLQTSSP